MNIHLSMVGIALAVSAFAGSARAQELTPEQQGKITSISLEFAEKGATLENMIQGKMSELSAELKREGRLDNPKEAKKSSKQVDALLKDLSDLYGKAIKTKVEFVIAAKNILTPEQKQLLLSQLKPQEALPFESVEYMQPDIFDLPLNLDLDQRKQLISLEAAMMVKQVELDRDVGLVLLDLEKNLFSSEAKSDAIDPLVMKLATLAGKEIDNHVDYFLKVKNVLTLDQKRLLIYMLGLD